jgi:hypothetical protein
MNRNAQVRRHRCRESLNLRNGSDRSLWSFLNGSSPDLTRILGENLIRDRGPHDRRQQPIGLGGGRRVLAGYRRMPGPHRLWRHGSQTGIAKGRSDVPTEKPSVQFGRSFGEIDSHIQPIF